MALNFRVPAPIVDEAFASLEANSLKEAKDARFNARNGPHRGRGRHGDSDPRCREPPAGGQERAGLRSGRGRGCPGGPAAATVCAAAATTSRPGVAPEDPITQIERLGALKAQGLITEEEFNAQKAKILGL